MIYRL
jgi:Ca2+-binding RTX toxin-like protein